MPSFCNCSLLLWWWPSHRGRMENTTPSSEIRTSSLPTQHLSSKSFLNPSLGLFAIGPAKQQQRQSSRSWLCLCGQFGRVTAWKDLFLRSPCECHGQKQTRAAPRCPAMATRASPSWAGGDCWDIDLPQHHQEKESWSHLHSQALCTFHRLHKYTVLAILSRNSPGYLGNGSELWMPRNCQLLNGLGTTYIRAGLELKKPSLKRTIIQDLWRPPGPASLPTAGPPHIC